VLLLLKAAAKTALKLRIPTYSL